MFDGSKYCLCSLFHMLHQQPSPPWSEQRVRLEKNLGHSAEDPCIAPSTPHYRDLCEHAGVCGVVRHMKGGNMRMAANLHFQSL